MASAVSRLDAWLDHRTGYRKIMHEALYENVPGGARWRYVWGSTLTFAFVTQAITGIFLWMGYAPSSQTAWESVYYIQNEMYLGWWLRGIHHFMAQAMIVLLALHLLQVVIDGAYRAPREVNFWIGLILMQIVMGLGLTGYLLPWDQKGYWATSVATNIMGQTPLLGPYIQKVVVGGREYGHHTLTRFFALHAGVLPALLVGFLVLHIAVFRRHGLHAKHRKEPMPDQPFWPDQILKDAIACLAVFLAVLGCVWWFKGAELGPPADPSSSYDAARPEWYFLFLFQLLELVPGPVGAFIIPGLIMAVLIAMPIVGRWELGHRFNIAYLFGILLGAGVLTAMAIKHDRETDSYKDAVAQAKRDGHRAADLARMLGVPPEGANKILRSDPLFQGGKLFRERCAVCHTFNDGKEIAWGPRATVAKEGEAPTGGPSAPNLFRFGSREWLTGFFDPKRIVSDEYFGGTKHKDGQMVDAVKAIAATPEDKEKLKLAIVALSAEAQLPFQREKDAKSATQIAAGKEVLNGSDPVSNNCADCHRFHGDDPGAGAPDLTGYASRAWLKGIISNPAHASYYGENNDRMPEFQKDMTAEEIDLIVGFLREEYPGAEHGQTIIAGETTQPAVKPAPAEAKAEAAEAK